MLKSLDGTASLTTQQLAAGDINKNRNLDLLDVIAILNIAGADN